MSATSRFLLEPAPGGLALLQDLVNTRPVPSYGVRDLFDTVTDAQRWVRLTVPAWREESDATGSVGRLAARDLPGLRRLRADVERLLHGEAVPARRVPSSVCVGHGADRGAAHAADVVRLQPSGRGVRWLTSAVWGQALLSRLSGELHRLKICRGLSCPCAFYDRSRNNSRVWHDVTTCGNVANLRASRARLRATGG